nr:probable cyclic nucleotide-gated ion channel 10 [Malus domestica]
MICDYLRPVTYDENSFVVRTGDLLDRMIFITEGFIWTYVGGDQNRHGGGSSSGSQSSSMPTNMLKKGQFYGEELLYRQSSPSQLPISPQTVKCHTKVEAFVLMAKDWTSIVSKCRSLLPNNMNHGNNNKQQQQQQQYERYSLWTALTEGLQELYGLDTRSPVFRTCYAPQLVVLHVPCACTL